MKNKLICGLVTLVLISGFMATSSVKASAAETTKTIPSVVANTNMTVPTIPGAGTIGVKTAYDWYVYDVGVDSQDSSQVRGPISGGKFNTEGFFGSNRTFEISWSGAPSDASFQFYADGVDNGNSGSTNWSGGCCGESGSTSITVPYDDRGYVKIYVYSTSDSTISIDEIHVDSR